MSDATRRLLDPAGIVLFDGAMGTMLYARGVFINQCYDELNLRAPELVRGVHRDYVRAGAEALETNTFGANRLKLRHHGLEAQVHAINHAAAALARDVADREGNGDVLVAGAVGPLGVRLEPYGPTAAEEARATFREQMIALAEGGVDCFILETFGDLVEIQQALLAARDAAPDLPVIAQMTIGADGRTPFGATAEDIALALDRWGADVIGLNCSIGPQTILEAIERMAAVTSRKLSAMPNAGMPRDVGGRQLYMASPEYMASYARHLVHGGAKVIGGCCGTTPEHTRAMAEGLRPLRPKNVGGRGTGVGSMTVGDARRGATGVAVSSAPDAPRPTPDAVGSAPDAPRPTPDAVSSAPDGRRPTPDAVPFPDRSRWAHKLAHDEFVTSVEIVPPRGVDATRMLADARVLRDAGVDAVNVPDGPRAQSRMGAMMTSVLLEQQAGIETVTHYACRDRNLLGMLSDLLGASAVGLRNLLLITGDPPKMGPYPDATAVFDIDSIGLTNLVRNLNHGRDPGGNAIGAPTRFAIGVGMNPAAIDLEQEIRRFEWKVDAGAEFAVTQPVFDPAQLERFLERTAHVRIPVVAGIWPLVSVRNAEFMANEVPGVSVPDHVMRRMQRAGEQSREHALAEGIAIAREMLERLRPMVQGAQVSAPFGRAELALEVLGAVPAPPPASVATGS